MTQSLVCTLHSKIHSIDSLSAVIKNFSVPLLKNTANTIAKLIDSKKTLNDVLLILPQILLRISAEPGFSLKVFFFQIVSHLPVAFRSYQKSMEMLWPNLLKKITSLRNSILSEFSRKMALFFKVNKKRPYKEFAMREC